MMNKEKMKQGSALVFVIIAVAFVGILASIVLRATLINVETKRVNSDMKKNQYTAETAMDDLNLSIQNIAAVKMKKAYAYLLDNYSTTMAGTEKKSSIQAQFAKKYLEGLVCAFTKDESFELNPNVTFNKKYDYEIINKEFEKTMSSVKASWKDTGKTSFNVSYIKKPEDERVIELVYSDKSNANNYLVLKNLSIDYEENGYSTRITTDLKLTVPKINFQGGSIYPDFTKFCIIGDKNVESTVAANNYGIGNVYAGEGGLEVCGDLKLSGSSSKLITRGDVVVQKGGALVAGGEYNPIAIWAENIGTSSDKFANPNERSGNTSPAKLTVRGNCYIHDDLNLNSSYSTVDIDNGNYYGYTYSKDNDTVKSTDERSIHSSAILINGKNSALKMGSNMKQILLGGRAFVSKGNDTYNKDMDNDIMIGQAISVKSDQSFALVAKEYLQEGVSNPMPEAALKRLGCKDGDPDLTDTEYLKKNKIMTNTGLKAMKPYVNSRKPFIPYYYTIGTSGCMVYFYYNFKSQQAANEYFAKVGRQTLIQKAATAGYLRFEGTEDDIKGISISSNLSIFAYANYYSNTNKETEDKSVTNFTDEFKTGKFQDAIKFAAEYRSLQEILSNGYASKYETSTKSETDDGTGFDIPDKTKNRVFDALLTGDDNYKYKFVKEREENADTNGFHSLSSSGVFYKCVPVEIAEDKYVYAIFLVGKDGSDGSYSSVKLSEVMKAVSILSTDTAIVVGNCDIVVDQSINGLVISVNKVSMIGSGFGVTAQSALLQEMFTAQKRVEVDNATPASRKFLTYFKCFSDLDFGNSDATDKNIALSNYFHYQNWKKNDVD